MNPKANVHHYGLKRYRQISHIIGKVSHNFLIRRDKPAAMKALFVGLSQLGGLYAKFLQLMFSSRPDLPGLKEAINYDIYDQQASPEVDIVSILRQQLPEGEHSRLQVKQTPMAAGSFAIVYEAIYDNQPVVIKYLRPGIKRQIKTDLRMLKYIMRVATPILPIPNLDLNQMLKHFGKNVNREINYKSELEAALRMHESYQDHPSIYIPKTYANLSSQNLIIQEKLNGIPLSDLMRKQIYGQDAIDYIRKKLGSDLVKQLEELAIDIHFRTFKGPLHGDPHAGNIFLMSQDRVGLIDFGLVLEPIPAKQELLSLIRSNHRMCLGEKVEISDHIMTILQLFNYPIYRSLLKISDYIKSKGSTTNPLDELKKLADKMVEPFKEEFAQMIKHNGFVPLRAIEDRLNLTKRFSVKTDGSLVSYGTAMSQSLSTLRNLGLDSRKSWSRIYEKLEDLIAAAPESPESKQESTSLSESTQIINEWITRLMQQEPLLFGSLFASIRKTLHDS